MGVVFIICVTIVVIVALGLGFDEGLGKVFELKQKKLEEEHKTANLALAYQILSTRPELSLDDVKQLISFSNNPEKLGINSSTTPEVNQDSEIITNTDPLKPEQ